MRICIITLPRTGGTRFAVWLARELDYSRILEPYWTSPQRVPKYTNYDIWEKPDTVTKWIIDEFDFVNRDIEECLSAYDFVIVHSRNNLYEECKSFIYAKENMDGMNWHTKYSIPIGWEELNKDKIETSMNHYSVLKSKLLNLPASLYTTYEGIYYGDESKNIANLLNFTPKYLDMLDTSNRYLVESKTHKTLL